MPAEQTIHLHRDAPPKPAPGGPCNGCGVCCAAETCPAARLIFRQAHGPCPALEWHAGAACYRCGLLTAPDAHLRWLPGRWRAAAAPVLSRLFARWIAAGQGCDSSADIVHPPTEQQ